jgi:hypothetical protein
MGTILELKARLQKVDVAYEAETAIDATKTDIITRQKDQLLHGLRADGTLIGKYKSKVYAAKKYAQNPLPGFGNMDWRLTGALYGDIFVDVRRDIYVIDSADPKMQSLEKQFGDPMGLDEANQTGYVEEKLRPQFMKQIHQVTGI